MAAIGDVYRIRMFGTCLGEEVMCRLHYQLVQFGTGDLEMSDIALEFGENVANVMKSMMHSQSFINGVEIQNLMNLQEYVISQATPYPYQGTINGDGQPSFVCYTFRKNRPYPPLRHGYTRLWGVGDFVALGNYVDASFIPQLNLIAAALEAPLTTLNTYGFIPVVVRNASVNPPLPSEIWPVSEVVFNGLGSQITRKR